MTNILYVENCAEINGGSWLSLKVVIDALPKDAFKPYVLFTSSRINSKNLKIDPPFFIIKKRDIYFNSNFFGNAKHSKFCKFIDWAFSYPFFLIDFLLFVLPHSFKLANLIRKNNIKIVHLNNNIYGQLSAIIAAKMTGAQCVCHIRSSRLPVLKVEKMFSRFIDMIINISDRGKSDYLKAGLDPRKLSVIYDPIDLEKGKLSETQQRTLRSEIGLMKDDFCVGIFSRITKGKGHDVFIKSALDILNESKNSDFKFVIIGEATEYEKAYQEEIANLAKGSKHSSKIVFLGYRKDVYKIIQILDVMVDASALAEGLRRTVVEAMLLGKPIIATNVGADADYIRNYETGLLIKPNDACELAKSILYLHENPDSSKKIAANGQELVCAKYNCKESIRKTIGIYNGLMEKRN